MKLRQWIGSLIIFISGYSPLAIIYTIQNISLKFGVNDVNIKEEFLNIKTASIGLNHPTIILLIWLIVILCCICTSLILKGFTSGSGKEGQIKKISNRSGDLILYTIPYLLVLLSMDFDNISRITSYLVFMSVIFYLMVKTHKIFLNPFLLLLGFNLYDVEYEYLNKERSGLFLAKTGILRIGEKKQIKELGDNVYIVTK